MSVEFQILNKTDERLARWLEASSGRMIAACFREMKSQMSDLASYVKSEKLSGPTGTDTLSRRTGALSRATHGKATEDDTNVTGTVGVDNTVPYARILHEGGTIERHSKGGKVRLRTNARGELLGGVARFAKKSHSRVREVAYGAHDWQVVIQARPYLTSALEEKRAAIMASLGAAIQQSVKP